MFVAGEQMEVSLKPPTYARWMKRDHYRFETHVTGGVGWVSIAAYIFRAILTRSPDVVVSSEYRRGFLVNLALLLTWHRARHLIVGMNLSAKPITSRWSVLRALIDRVFARSSAIIVHSTREAELFAALHHLPPDHFAFCHWGFDLPTEDSGRFEAEERPYFCLIGRNNRDLETFAKAVQMAGAHGIAIVPGYLQIDPWIERSLQIHRDLSMADCISCIRNAAANVTLLKDNSRGAGHITVVTAMHLGVPQIYSDSEVLREYFPQGRFGTAVPLGDAAAAAEAMRDLLRSPVSKGPDRDRLAAERRVFARDWLSNDRMARRVAAVLTDTVEDRVPSALEPEWNAWLRGAHDPLPEIR